MPTDHRAALAKIRRFDQLIAYLRDEMGWPIARDSFEDVNDLFYDFTAAELGIDAQNAAKIQEIKRLRPLSSKQPWGIFFVKFEPKNLPVVALRRILSQVALKKRPSANSAERAAWAADDLLFISNYGEGDERQISFAHFSKAQDGNDLPTLKVLGWDNLDTALHLDNVAHELTKHLAWPDDDADAEAWRKSWRAAFNLRHREVVTTSQHLSIRLAELARAIRDRIKAALAIETEVGPLTKLMTAFQEALVHDLDAAGFADMYAQTIAYGLLSARIADPEKKTTDDFAAHMRTNPFLRELMETFLHVGGRRGKAGGPGIDFDELGVSEVVELLDDSNMEAIVRDFGDRNPQEDPVIHFYELFLKEYDPRKRMQRGVFYTPRPVVSYIVRSVDKILRSDFGLEDGLADTTSWGELVKRQKQLKIPEGIPASQTFVQILDPATGTGTFLVEVIDLIYKTLVAKWNAQGHGERKIEVLWNEYVPKYLLPRLYGYELLMAPYAIAHLKIGLKLYETGYRFGSDERARIYLTNTLEPAQDFSEKFEFVIPALAHEAQAVNDVKRTQRFTVVIGNPPYSGISSNMTDYAQALVDAFKVVDGRPLNERKHWLQDDYVKFFRVSQLALEKSSAGVLGMISNHAFLDNPTFRGMRQSLLGTFSDIKICDLHGSAKKSDLVPVGIVDENVFDIQQGVAITIATSRPMEVREIHYANLWGTREDKYKSLGRFAIGQMEWSSVVPETPYYFFIPKDLAFQAEYYAGWPITEVMPVHVNGILTARDGFVIDFEDEPIDERVRVFLDKKLSDAQVKEKLGLSENYAWRVHDARRELRGVKDWSQLLTDILYRPFDIRRIIYHSSVVWRTRSNVMRHMIAGRNLGLCTNRQVNGEFRHVGVTRNIINDCTLSLATKERTFLFPMFLYPDEEVADLLHDRQPRPNIGAKFAKALATAIGDPKNSEASQALNPEKILNYAYAVFHSPCYRARFAEFLKFDFPRLLVPADFDLFRDLAQIGENLVALHLLEAPGLNQFITTYVGPKNPEVDRVGWVDNAVWLDAPATKKGHPSTPGTIGFQGVSEAVWNFHIGGYQVCEKWLKDRRGHTLSKDDVAHYQKIVVALSETIRLMGKIDDVIEKHGGWPGAFAQGDGVARDVTIETEDAGTVVPLKHPKSMVASYQPAPAHLLQAAEPQAPSYETVAPTELDARRPNPDELDREELICRIRQLFGDGQERERDAAIDALARELGYQRTGGRIQEELDNALRTAVRRGILTSERGIVCLFARTIEQYGRDFLKEQFLASLPGRQWIEREDAVRAFARWMGFRRTGSAIEDSARSLVNGLLREGRLESGGSQIRRSG